MYIYITYLAADVFAHIVFAAADDLASLDDSRFLF